MNQVISAAKARILNFPELLQVTQEQSSRLRMERRIFQRIIYRQSFYTFSTIKPKRSG